MAHLQAGLLGGLGAPSVMMEDMRNQLLLSWHETTKPSVRAMWAGSTDDEGANRTTWCGVSIGVCGGCGFDSCSARLSSVQDVVVLVLAS